MNLSGKNVGHVTIFSFMFTIACCCGYDKIRCLVV